MGRILFNNVTILHQFHIIEQNCEKYTIYFNNNNYTAIT